MRTADYQLIAGLIRESATAAASTAGLTGAQEQAFMAAFVAHAAFVLQNQQDGRSFNPYAFAADAGYPMRYPCAGDVDETTQRVADLYAGGGSLLVVADELGLPVADVRERLVRAGVDIRRR